MGSVSVLILGVWFIWTPKQENVFSWSIKNTELNNLSVKKEINELWSFYFFGDKNI